MSLKTQQAIAEWYTDHAANSDINYARKVVSAVVYILCGIKIVIPVITRQRNFKYSSKEQKGPE